MRQKIAPLLLGQTLTPGILVDFQVQHQPLRALAQAFGTEERVLWVEDAFQIYPAFLEEKGWDLNRCLWVEAKGQAEWIVLQALRSQAVSVIIWCGDVSRVRDSGWRRLQIEAEKSKIVCVVWPERPIQSAHWVFRVRVRDHEALSPTAISG